MKFVYIAILLLAIFVRVYGLTSFPPSLYWEEVALGYDAYSIAQTGKDYHGNSLPIVAFESFGDWKPSGYFYVVVPFVWLFGLSEWAVRLPTVIAGLLLIIGTAKIARQVGVSPLVALGVGAVSPWAVQFSRAGWEVMSATALLVWANYFALQAVGQRKVALKTLLLAVILFAASMYTYHATRVIVPLQLIGLAILYLYKNTQATTLSWLKQLQELLRENLWQVGAAIVLLVVLVLPILTSLSSATTSQRFQETSIFSDITVIERSNQLKEAANNSLVSRIFYHRYVLFSGVVLANFASHFSLDFLFLNGDANLRHSLQFYGQLYHIEALFLLVGLFVWLRKKSPERIYLLYWVVAAIIPAALTIGTPHALRILAALPVFLVIVALGVEVVAQFLTAKSQELVSFYKLAVPKNWISFAVVAVVIGVYLIEFVGFWRYYSVVYPQVASSQWQYGYKEMIATVVKLQTENPELPVYITREQGRPAMYYWFYTKTNPREVQALNASMPKDQAEFLQYKNVYFIDRVDQVTQPGIVASSAKFGLELSSTRVVEVQEEIKNLSDEVVWQVQILTE